MQEPMPEPMPEPVPENAREQSIHHIQKARQAIESIQLMESKGEHQKSDAESELDEAIYSQSQLLLKVAFTLGPSGKQCDKCNGTGRLPTQTTEAHIRRHR